MADLSQPIAYAVAGMDSVVVQPEVVFGRAGDRELALDVYLPSDEGGGPWPAVLLVPGTTDPGTMRGVRGWGQYVSWGRLAAASGLAAVVAEHRSLTEASLDQLAGEVTAALAWCRRQGPAFGVDPDRLAVFGVSAGVPLALAATMADPGDVRCLVCYYGPFRVAPRPPDSAGFSALDLLRADPAAVPPLLAVRAGQDRPGLNATIEEFASVALAANLPFELINHPAGRHGFDVLDRTDETRHVILRTVQYLRARLGDGQADP